MNLKKILTIIFFSILVVLPLAFKNSQVQGVKDESLLVYFLDIGQGDATLIRTPNDQDIIIDGGPDNTLIKKLGAYLPFYDHKIETIILTHPDSDHVSGLVEVLRRYQVDRVLLTKVLSDTPSYQAFLSELEKNKINSVVINSQQKIDLGGGVFFDIFYPTENFEGKEVESTNNTSISGKLIYDNTSIMFTGDLEIEESLLDDGLNLKSDIYHVGHHGSNNANDLKFVSAVDPTYAIVSVGASNRYGHPQYRTLKNLQSVEAEVWRTDESGDVIFYSNGLEFQPL